MMKDGSEIIRNTYSICPVCLNRIPAQLIRVFSEIGGNITSRVELAKECIEHGYFSTTVWKDRFSFEDWTSREEPLGETESQICTGDCRTCSGHLQDTCCVILEVTQLCNLRCRYCFARGGENSGQPAFEDLCCAIDDIVSQAGSVLIQFSGGEPTLRDDLPELISYARKAGCGYTQVNTNGIRLSNDPDYLRQLAEAGLDIVFLQFDGTDDSIYRQLRGCDLLDIKLRAIENCSRYGIGVTLVPTVVRGVNDNELGSIVKLAAELFPAVKSVHFQPVTYLGRYPEEKTHNGTGTQVPDHFTLDELMEKLCVQTGIPEKALLPSRCDHAVCEFHSTFMVNSRRQLIPMTDRAHDTRRERTRAAANRQYVAEHWKRAISDPSEYRFDEMSPDQPLVTTVQDIMDFDEFSHKMRTHTMKVSAMAFQDAMNIDLERLARCSLHVYENGSLLPFCAKYMTPIRK